jgi:glycosyltransferase involved in cell wall biosynthesis
MRVHHIISDYSMFTGGAERLVRALHTGLRERGVESYIFGLLSQKDHELEGAQSLDLRSPYGLKALLGTQRYLAKNVRPEDILHVHLFPPLFYVSLLKILGRAPGHLLCTEHSTSNHRRGRLSGRILDSITYVGYRQVVAISNGVEQELLNWRPALKGKTRVILNGVELYFKKEIQRASIRRLKVLSVGNPRPAKNYENALRAVALLKDLDFEYEIAGAGESLDELLRLRQELNLESRVRFLGHVEDVPSLLASADIFLMPSRWEGFGLAAVEAMNASLPLVVGDVPGLREIVEGASTCALFVDPISPESIAAGIRQLLASAPLRFELGQNAFSQAQKFSLEPMIESYINLYAEFV